MSQPSYWCIANIGDANPIEHGGAFILVDRNGIYPPTMIILEREDYGDSVGFELVTVELEDLTVTSDGGLCDNKFHCNLHAWFGDPSTLKAIAAYAGKSLEQLRGQFVSDDPKIRAMAYRDLVSYQGVDPDPDAIVPITEEAAEAFVAHAQRQIEEAKTWHEGYGISLFAYK